VRLAQANTVIVAAMAGTVRVTNASGVLVAAMDSGRELSFDPGAGAAAPTRLTGCLLQKSGQFIVADLATNVTMNVQGDNLHQELGNKVEVTGAVENQVLKVANLKEVAKGGCTAVAKKVGAVGALGAAGTAGAAGAAGATGSAAAAGISTAATVAIVGGVAVAGTAGGLAASGTFSSSEPSPSSSR
jgi:hypothetical protein